MSQLDFCVCSTKMGDGDILYCGTRDSEKEYAKKFRGEEENCSEFNAGLPKYMIMY